MRSAMCLAVFKLELCWGFGGLENWVLGVWRLLAEALGLGLGVENRIIGDLGFSSCGVVGFGDSEFH